MQRRSGEGLISLSSAPWSRARQKSNMPLDKKIILLKRLKGPKVSLKCGVHIFSCIDSFTTNILVILNLLFILRLHCLSDLTKYLVSKDLCY